MADIRCPMCGKNNPDDREICQYCEARLKPLIADSNEEQSAGSEQGPFEFSDSDEEQTPDWLKSLRNQDDQTPETPSTDLPLPEWLIPARETRRFNTGEIEMGNLGDETWLDSFRSGEEAQEEDIEEEVEAAESSEEEQTWEFQEEVPDDHLDDWLSGGNFATRSFDEGGSPQEVEQEEIEPASPAHDEEPEWLQKVRSRAQEDKPPEEFPEDEASEGEVFLESLRSQDKGQTLGLNFESGELDSQSAVQEPEPEEQPAAVPAGETPGWLSKFGVDENDQEEEQELEESPEEIDQLSEEPFEGSFELEAGISSDEEEDLSWLSQLDSQASPDVEETPASESVPNEEQPEDAEFPDWLAGLTEGGLGEVEVESLGEGAEIEKPDWLMPFTEMGETEDASEGFDLEGEAEESFDWLEDADELDIPASEPVAHEGTSDGMISPFGGEGADWSLEEVEESLEREDSDGVVQADLPNWLEAMRPVEAAAVVPPPPEDRTREPESSGPLAGLRGIIPAEPDIARMNASTVYSLKLQVSETQLAYAKSLEAMVESEGLPAQAQRRTVLTSQNILRMIVFVVLVALVSFPIFTASRQSPLPLDYYGTSDAQRAINDLEGSSSVLVAVDYQPAISGEMETAASAVIDHLMIKGAYLTMVSTHPTGAVQAERLVRRVNERHNHHYQSIEQYAVLGYIPGGTSGLAAFSQSARQTLPFALNSTEAGSVWDRTPLQAISQPEDFGMIVVITENAETARAWVEQVGESLVDTPLIMVASAQAAPMIMPYYESNARQVDGMIIGLTGAGAYEAGLNRQTPIIDYWDAFGYGIGAAILIVLIGGAYNIVMAVIAQQRKREEAG